MPLLRGTELRNSAWRFSPGTRNIEALLLEMRNLAAIEHIQLLDLSSRVAENRAVTFRAGRPGTVAWGLSVARWSEPTGWPRVRV